MKRNISSIGLIMPIIFGSCLEQFKDLDKVQDYTWNPELSLPIANSTFGLIEFLKNDSIQDYVQTDDNGVIIFSYQDQFKSQDASSYVEIPDETYNDSFTFDAPLLLQLPIDLEISKTDTFSFDLDNEEGDEIDSVILKSGQLELFLQANFPASGEASFIFHSATENGLPLQRTYTWDYTGQQPVLDVDDVIDLSNIKFDLTKGGTTTNLFEFNVEVRLFYEGEPVLPTNSLEMSVMLLDAQFDAAYGLIAPRDISSDAETIQLDFFESILDGSFYLDDPTISLEFSNSFGIPVGVRVNNLSASNPTESLFLSGDITMDQQIINAPGIDQIGQSVSSTIIIDNTNSNIAELVSLLPTEVTYQLEGTVNPENVTDRSFVLGESAVDIGLNVQLPLIGKVSDLRIEQEFDFNGPEILDDFNFVLAQISVENGFPIDTEIQIFFLDQYGQILDHLIENDQNIIPAAEVDAEGIVTNPAQKVSQIELDRSKIDRVLNTHTLLLEASFNTTDDGNVSVQILDSYNLKIKIGVQTEFNIKVDL